MSTAKLKNRITDEPIDATDPSTPDDLVNSRRLLGRLAYRRAPEKEPLGQHDTDFWLGWLDGRLAGLYERLKKQLGR